MTTVRAWLGEDQAVAPAPQLAPVADGVPDLTLPGRARKTRGLRVDRRPGWCFADFRDEEVRPCCGPP